MQDSKIKKKQNRTALSKDMIEECILIKGDKTKEGDNVIQKEAQRIHRKTVKKKIPGLIAMKKA